MVRKLRTTEVADHETHTRTIAEVRDRLALFRMLDRNYADWRRYLNRLLSADFKEDVDVSQELNRLLLNYLILAYAIEQHFSVSYGKRYKKDPARLAEYAHFVDRLCAASWPFAFVMDYRGHVQHVELGIFLNNRIADESSVQIVVQANPTTLLRGSRGWKRSNLREETGYVDLISTLREFHAQMMTNYRGFVTKIFFPELNPVSKFYAELTREVRKRDPSARMILFAKKPKIRSDNAGKLSSELEMLLVPNDVFVEPSIIVRPAKDDNRGRSPSQRRQK